LTDGGTDRVIFALPPTAVPTRNSVVTFALPKAGSVLLDNVMKELSKEVGLSYVSIMFEYFNLGISDDCPPDTSEIFLRYGYCYGGFRYLPKFSIPILPFVKKVLLVRDPRDMLVSHYYSMLKSHPAINGALNSGTKQRELAMQLDIDAYVRETAPAYKEYLSTYRQLCVKYGAHFYRAKGARGRRLTQLWNNLVHRRQIRIYRYEDIVYSKRHWIQDLCKWFGFDVSKERCAEIAGRYHYVPEKEDENIHMRQVHPGNHKSKLSKETIEYLTGFFSNDMKFFGYPT
jgi:hypothetical protein